MNLHASLLGFYQPGDGWLFRLHLGLKYLLMVGVTLPALILRSWWLTATCLVGVMLCLITSGISARRALRLGWVMWLLLGLLVVYHLATLNPIAAFVQPGNLLLAILAARMLTLTTPTPEILAGLTTAFQPLRFLGLKPQRLALVVALMLRSIPYVLGLFDEAKQAANARGVGRNPIALLLPVTLGAVSHAERTAEALAARGIAER